MLRGEPIFLHIGVFILLEGGTIGGVIDRLLKKGWISRVTSTKDRRSRELALRVGRRVSGVRLGDPKSRWGSCSPEGGLSYSWRLILAPPFVLDYVVAHEVAHLVELNHGRRFWRLVAELVGDIDAPRAWLRANGTRLLRHG